MNIEELSEEILAAKLTLDDIETLYDVLKLKQSRIARQQMRSLEIGDRVRFTNIKPKYMVGEEGTVTGFNNTRILVKLDHPIGKFSGGPLKVPATCVVKIEPFTDEQQERSDKVRQLVDPSKLGPPRRVQ